MNRYHLLNPSIGESRLFSEEGWKEMISRFDEMEKTGGCLNVMIQILPETTNQILGTIDVMSADDTKALRRTLKKIRDAQANP
jgi:hypothetical protein